MSKVKPSTVLNPTINISIMLSLIMFFCSIFCISKTFGAKKPDSNDNTANLHLITGAFGVKLGDVFEPSSAIGARSLSDGTPMYQFNPTKRFRSFERYFVLITPKSHIIYSIWGIGQCKDAMACEKDQDYILNLLQNKYGVKEKEAFIDTLTTIKQIDQGNRFIILKCSGFPNTSIEIRYYDRKLDKIAEMEQLELKSSEIDDSAL